MVIESKSAEELALEMFLQEARNTRTFLHVAHKAAVAGDEVMASKWDNLAQIHRRNVSTLARIIRAIRAEKEETDTNPQTRDEMTNREKIIRINEIAVRCINAGPISLESGIEDIREIVNGVSLDEPREVPAEVEFDAEEITRIADAAVNRIVREHFPDLDKTTPLKPREKTLLEREAAIYGAVFANAYPHVSTRVAMSHAEDAVEAWRAAQKGGDDG